MKILTLWQPWASLIALGLKQYETRSWSTTYRGPLLIHAAKRPFVSEDGSKVLDHAAVVAWLDALEAAYKAGVIKDGVDFPLAHQLPLGKVVAIADLTDCIQMTEPMIEDISTLEYIVGDWDEGRYAWKLENIRALAEPIEWKGGQGFRNVPRELKKAVEKQLEVGHD